MIVIIDITIFNQVKNDKNSLELQLEACKAEIKMTEVERPLQQVGTKMIKTKTMLALMMSSMI